MAGASETELREAFKLFDADGDGMISADELKTLISKVGCDWWTAGHSKYSSLIGGRWAARWQTPRPRRWSRQPARTATKVSTSGSSLSCGRRSTERTR